MSFTIEATSTCPGCCAEACTTLECRVRGGTVALCGFDEFTGYESTPPRFYLDKILGGSIVICDYHSPSGKGPCWDDGCNSPVGWSAQVAMGWSCFSPEPGCKGFNLGMDSKIEVVAAYDTPGSPGNVTLEFYGYATSYGCATDLPSWIGRINGSIFMGSYTGPTVETAKVSRPNGTQLGMQLTVDVGCSPFGDCSGVVCTGEDGALCVSDCARTGSAASAGFDGLTWCVPTRTGKRWSYAGKAAILPTPDCTESIVDSREQTSSGEVAGCNPPTSGGTVVSTTTAFEPEFAAYVTDDPLNSGSFKGQISNDACVTDSKATHCDRFEQLQSEDTDENAITRLLASPAGAWADWKPTGDGTGGTCIQQVCCRSAWEIRTYRTFEYKEAQWRATVAGLTPGTEVDIFIGVYRRAYGVGTYELFQTIQETRTANMSGIATATGDVPNAEGFETFVGCTYRRATE